MIRLKNIRKSITNYTFLSQLILLIVFVVVFVGLFFAIIKARFVDDNNYLKIVISGIITVSVGCLTMVRTQEDKSRQAALQYITEKRLDWLKDTRSMTVDLYKNAAFYLYDDIDKSSSESLDNMAENDKLISAYADFMGAIAGLYVRYNFKGERDQILLRILDAIQEKMSNYKEYRCSGKTNGFQNVDTLKNNIRKLLELLMLHTQVYTKLEWERVKEETIYEGSINLRRKYIKKKMVKKRLQLYKDRDSYDKEEINVLQDYTVEAVCEKLKNK